MDKGILIKNIKCLVNAGGEDRMKLCGSRMSELDTISDAFLMMSDGVINDFGRMADLEISSPGLKEDYEIIDADGRMVLPAFCDSHTHLVYAGSREKEYIDKIKGLSYAEIAARGGGIINSARLLHETSEEELYQQSVERVREIMLMGTGAVEIKSGYGLNTEDEIKMLKVIRRIKQDFPLEVKATFLGAHSVPLEYRNRRNDYVEIVINEMIPRVVSEELADYIDVFCDEGFFTAEDTERILMAGMKYGLRAKLHANELGYSGGIQSGVKYDALSVDHLECTGDEEIRVLLDSDTMPTLLPGSAFFLGMPYPPARKMISAGLPLALASDYNPGSSPCGNMKLIMSLGCIKLRMLPEEVINAVTINSAYAMGISDAYGYIGKGRVASVIVTGKIPSYEYLPYAFGSDLIDIVILKGKIIKRRETVLL
jgi:imidazolonepropionase